MNSLVILLGAAAILTFDTIGSLASRRFAFSYSRLMLGSFTIYCAVGFAVSTGASVTLAALAGAIVGLVDSTIGWAISWRIGPGRPADQYVTISRVLGTVAYVTALAAILGAVGGGLRLIVLRGAA